MKEIAPPYKQIHAEIEFLTKKIPYLADCFVLNKDVGDFVNELIHCFYEYVRDIYDEGIWTKVAARVEGKPAKEVILEFIYELEKGEERR